MRLTASKLREDIYSILDQVLETGVSVEIERKGKILRIEPPARSSKLARLSRRPIINGGPDDVLNVDWTDTWRP